MDDRVVERSRWMQKGKERKIMNETMMLGYPFYADLKHINIKKN